MLFGKCLDFSLSPAGSQAVSSRLSDWQQKQTTELAVTMSWESGTTELKLDSLRDIQPMQTGVK